MAPWWIAAPVIVLLAVVAVVVHRQRSYVAVPLADAPSLRDTGRRTSLLRAGLVVAVGGALAATYLTAPRPTGELRDLVSPERQTVVVLDLSHSVSDLVYREIARTLEGIATSGQDDRIGLVLFSDTALEALPPGSRAAELAPFIRYFRPRAERGQRARPSYYRAAGPTEQAQVQYPLNPWYRSFSGGTQISTGLRAARQALARDGLSGRVVLLSDLAESESDYPRLAAELRAYEQSPELELHVVALPPATDRQARVFERAAGADRVVDSQSLATGNQGIGEPALGLAWPYLAAALALALLLATYELVAVPLRWRVRPGRTGA